MTRAASAALLFVAAALAGCAKDPGVSDFIEPPPDPGPPDWPRGLRVVGNHIEDANQNTITLHGVNRSGTEYMCQSGGGIFDGPAYDESVEAIRTWPNVNSVRIPLNESCWLGIIVDEVDR
jgi:endoglucanase